LSAAEVLHAARIGLCSISSATKPPQRVFVARGDWAIHSVGAPRAGVFDGLTA
jgi:hypothetical protein